MNQQRLIGRLGANPEEKKANTSRGERLVVETSLAVDVQGGTQWWDVAAWGDGTEHNDLTAALLNFRKGDRVEMKGRSDANAYIGTKEGPLKGTAIARLQLTLQVEPAAAADDGWG